MKIVKYFSAISLILCLAGCEEPEVQKAIENASEKNEHIKTGQKNSRMGNPITVNATSGGAKFYDLRTRRIFEPRGVNYFWIVPDGHGGYQDRFFGTDDFDIDRVRDDFALLSKRGYNVVRIFLDTCNDDPSCIGNPAGGLNMAYLGNIVETMHAARDYKLLLLLTSNDLPSQGGYWQISDEGASPQFGPYRNRHYLTEPGIAAGKQYWDDLMSGLSTLGAPFEAVFAWSLLNEQWYDKTIPPFSLTSGLVTCANGNSYDMSNPADKKAMAVEGMEYYIDVMSDVIASYDPNTLITMGFFAPDYPNPSRPGDFRYVETEPLLHTANLDFFDFHAYPGGERLEDIAQNFGMIGYHDKPVIMGEVGCFIHLYPTIDDAIDGLIPWVAESCHLGFDGWLYWGVYRATVAHDATWAFMDIGGEKIEEALSFSKHPDFCEDGIIPVNLARDREVYASRSLATEPPNFVTDGDYSTQWGSGAPPLQWIEIDFGTPVSINRVKLTVAQYPEGYTKHDVWITNSSGSSSRMHLFYSNTADNDVLQWRPTFSVPDVQKLRIVTRVSPSWVSWKEIEVY